MAVCKIEGKSDMYGLGIRLGFYFLWYGAILARWLAPTEIKSLAYTNDVFVAATFLALIIATATDVYSLEPVETYIVLLLMFGTYLVMVPMYIWRLLSACDPYWVSIIVSYLPNIINLSTPFECFLPYYLTSDMFRSNA
jgi:predicted branched-subunit amino acid permease